MIPFIVLLWIATGLTTLDAIRRPAPAWVAADRRRSFWVSGLVISSLMLLPSVVFVPAYLVGVVPFMGGGKRPVIELHRGGAMARPTRGGAVDEFRRR